jgi:hypothetical protein
VNVPAGEQVQFVSALGAALLARHRLNKLNEQGVAVAVETDLDAVN